MNTKSLFGGNKIGALKRDLEWNLNKNTMDGVYDYEVGYIMSYSFIPRDFAGGYFYIVGALDENN